MGLTAPPLLRAEALRQRYGSRVVLDIDELEVRRGEVLAVLGPNGAGKSTLFRLLLLLEQPDAGRVLIDGRQASVGDLSAMRRMAGVFQRPHLFAGTVQANVAFGLRARRTARSELERMVSDALSAVGIAHLAEAPVQALSGGEAQRVALARALAVRPEILVLDEPTANLDVAVQQRLREDLERIARGDQRAVVLITHDPGDAFALADRVAVLEEGRVVQRGSPEEIVLDPATPFVAAFTGAELLLHGAVIAHEDELVVVELSSGATVLARGAQERVAIPVGGRAHIAYRPEDVLLAARGPEPETSARNHILARVHSVSPAGGLVRVRLSGALDLVALVTRRSAESLGLAPGVEVTAFLKATALRAFPAGREREPGG